MLLFFGDSLCLYSIVFCLLMFYDVYELERNFMPSFSHCLRYFLTKFEEELFLYLHQYKNWLHAFFFTFFSRYKITKCNWYITEQHITKPCKSLQYIQSCLCQPRLFAFFLLILVLQKCQFLVHLRQQYRHWK